MKTEKQVAPGKAETEGCEKYRDVFRRERELAAAVLEIQAAVKKAVLNREWVDFEAAMAKLARIGGEFEALDAERLALFENGEGQNGFYALAARLPGAERAELSGLYRELKMDVTRIKLENDALMAYLNEARIVVAGFLELIFPERKGRLYSRQGTKVEADMRSLILNKSF
ncbi:MAG: hypothetical protein LBQ38_01360 [Spirochaetaceae bacterium]|jgi:hypothetical protein|nr:hypothetical protein [Spirochaetaceae bacterium]